MKKLGKLKLNPEKLLNQDELVSFRGGSGGGCGPASGDLCIDCMASAQCACEISCGADTNCLASCVQSQSAQCYAMYC
jgi:hypothetical protein